MSLSAQKTTYLELKKSYIKRQKFKKKQKNKLRSILVLIAIFSFILPNILYSTYDYLFLRKIQNSAITIPNDISFLHKSEAGFANDYFMNQESFSEADTQTPLMTSMPLSHEMTKLKSRLQSLANQNPNLDMGIFIYDFSTGNYVDINADKAYPTASMIKIPIFLQLFRRIDMGMANLKSKMTLTDYYVTDGSGFLQYRPVGSVFSMSELSQRMIQESDNTATNMILSTLGGVDDINRDLRTWGFINTHMSNWLPDLDGTNVATPKDFATMFYNINNSKFVSIQSKAKIFDIMSHVKNRRLIMAGLPDNAQFIHKTGDIGTMLGDGGIIILPNGKRYIMVAMVKRPWNSFAAKQLIIDASKVTYNSFISKDL